MPDDAPHALIPSTLVAEDASYADLVEEFLNGLSDRLDAMRRAIEAEDYGALTNLAHQLRGAGGGYGYPVLSERAAALERHAVSHHLERCRAELEALLTLRPRIVVTA